MSGCGDNDWKQTDRSQAGKWRKSLEYDGTLITFEGDLGEFMVSIWKQYDEWSQR